MLRWRMVLGVAIISFSAIFVRLSEASPITVAFFRTAYAVPALWLLSRAMRRSSMRTRSQRLMAFGAGFAFAGDLAAFAEHRIVQVGVDVAQEDAVAQRALGLADLHTGRIGLLGAGHRAADQDQKPARVDGTAAQQGDGGTFDHQVAGQDALRHRVEFEHRQGRVSPLHRRAQTMRK